MFICPPVDLLPFFGGGGGNSQGKKHGTARVNGTHRGGRTKHRQFRHANRVMNMIITNGVSSVLREDGSISLGNT